MIIEYAVDVLQFAASTAPEPSAPLGGVSNNSGNKSLDYITPFLNFGLLGLFFLMFVFRKGVVPEWVLRQAEERHVAELEKKDADIAELKRLVAESTRLYNDQVVPAFTRSIDVNREYVELLRDERERPRRRTRAAGGSE